MLPLEIVEIITDYRESFDLIENLPTLAAVRRLKQSSDKNIVRIAQRLFGMPRAIFDDLLGEPCLAGLLVRSIVPRRILAADMDAVLMISVQQTWATSSLFWLFISKAPNIYFGPYARIFETSLLFRIISFTTSTTVYRSNVEEA